MIVELKYGKSTLPVAIPDACDVTVIRKKPLPVIDDPRRAVREALDAPVAAAPLSALARDKRSVCILICDVTRPVPNALFLRPMIEDLLRAGIAAGEITVLVATGLHRPNEGAELEALVGDRWVLDTVRVENHYARDDAAHVDFGVTANRGTPVKLDRRFVEAGLRIATGLVEPHFMAGYSGGRKVVAPGIAHQDTIRTFHSARFMEDPAAIQCNLEGNPLHEEQVEIMAMLGEVYALKDEGLREDAWRYFREEQSSDVEYEPFIGPDDPPAIGKNRATMAEFRARLEVLYYDPSRYDTYLEQLSIDYPQLEGPDSPEP